ncbi:MAG: hypothetical protein JRJ51_13130, partial [Deltaproteobacteria bacterium]|nr:hypothetical protein [Deltaproteobacteria bacterium]
MEETIKFVLSDFTLTCLVIGLLFSLISLAKKPRPLKKRDIILPIIGFALLYQQYHIEKNE